MIKRSTPIAPPLQRTRALSTQEAAGYSFTVKTPISNAMEPSTEQLGEVEQLRKQLAELEVGRRRHAELQGLSAHRDA